MAPPVVGAATDRDCCTVTLGMSRCNFVNLYKIPHFALFVFFHIEFISALQTKED